MDIPKKEKSEVRAAARSSVRYVPHFALRSDFFFPKDKIMNTKTFASLTGGLCLLAAVAGLAFSGCKSEMNVTTNPDGTTSTNTTKVLDAARVAATSRQVAEDATIDLLAQHPEWLTYFQTAESDLKTLAVSPNPSLNDLLAIVQRLPVKELHNETAQMSFEAATITLSIVNLPPVSATAAADIRTIAQAIADGVAAGLPAPPTPSVLTNAPAN